MLVAVAPRDDVDGTLVRALRLELGLSQMDFASRLGKEKVTVHRWETGGLDELTWLGLLSKLGIKPGWSPDREKLAAAKRSVRAIHEKRGSPKAGDV